MAGVTTGSQKHHRTENPFKNDFILPPKKSTAVKIVAPSLTPKQEGPPTASAEKSSVRPKQGANNPSSPDASLFIPPRKLGKPKFLDELSRGTTSSTVEQAPIECMSRGVSVPPGVSHSPNAQPGGGLVTTSVVQALRPTLDSTLDVYANNYIPLWQRAINESPAAPRPCRPLTTIDYVTYVNSFAGSRTLSTVPLIKLAPIHTVPYRISSLPDDLLPQHYGEYFSDALQNEIAAQFEDLKTFSMYNVAFEVADMDQQLYRFTIPGLREYSPRVDLGDVLKIRPLVAPPPHLHLPSQLGDLDAQPVFSGLEFYAVVWGLSRSREHILLRMDGFMPDLFRTCNVIFAVQEHRCTPLWRSIDLTARSLNGVNDPSSLWLRHMLFPDELHAKLQSSLSQGDFDLRWFDSEMNFEQQKAVHAVVTANYGCVPYLISGPPGTGKTKTIVETALQLLQSETSGLVPHILVCAPSDPAADTLATRLSAHLDSSSMLRLNSWTRSFAEVPENILPYTYAENNLFSLPDYQTMMSYKVIVTTCNDADMLVQARLTNEALIHLARTTLSAIAPKLSASIDAEQLIHWTALLLDEAAQAIEPEVLVPLSVVDPVFSLAESTAVAAEWSHPVPQLVMAGDEYQLGPRLSVKSTSALATSLFARLFARPLYNAHPLSRANGPKRLVSAMLPILRPPFTNLVRNYRSHAAILTVPSVLFYADTLIPERTALSDVVRTWPGWQEAGFFRGGRRVRVADIDVGDVRHDNAGPQNSSCWPILFVNNSGSDALESIVTGMGRGAGALFNDSEASIALSIVQSLLNPSIPLRSRKSGQNDPSSMVSRGYAPPMMTNNDSIQPTEIVVMSPFGAQVNYLRETFRKVGLYGVNIGPLEAFQGLESRIVILCTTRTRLGTDDQGRDRFVRDDQARGLGVIGEQKKFNVAITRAKEGLIVIGNKECLTCTGDEAWIEFLAYCERIESGRSAAESTRQPSVSYTHRQGRMERALRYGENVRRSHRAAKFGNDVVNGRQRTGFGYPDRQESSTIRLRGNMLSLEDDMFQEGLRIADEIDNNANDNTTYGVGYDEAISDEDHEDQEDHEDTQNTSVRNARQLLTYNANPAPSSVESLPSTMPASNEGALVPHIQHTGKAFSMHNETLVDISDDPTSTNGGLPSTSRGTSPPVHRKTLTMMHFGSAKLTVPTSSGEDMALGVVDPYPRSHEEVNNFDRDLKAEVERHERVDCATQ